MTISQPNLRMPLVREEVTKHIKIKERGGKSDYGRKKIPGMLLLWSVCGVHRFQEV